MSMSDYIQNSIRKINNEEKELQSKERRFRCETVETVDSWWKGEAGISFVRGYSQIDFEIKKLYSGIDNLQETLRHLASAVDRADEERRRREEEARRREEEARRKKEQDRKYPKC